MIYFLQPVDGGPIKIGYTANLEMRRKQLEKRYGRQLVLLATMEGGEREEAEIHARFAHLRLVGAGSRGVLPEQFRPAPELAEFLGLPPFRDDPSVAAMFPVDFGCDRGLLTVYLDRRVVAMARLIAEHEGTSVSAFFSDLLREPINAQFLSLVRKSAEHS